jgi:uncharacterized protein
MPRPIYFEIPAEDPARSIAFYEKVFGWKFSKWETIPHPYWTISTGDGPGIDGGLMLRHHPDQPCVNTISVTDIDAAIATLDAAGAQCALPKMAVPTVGWLAYYKDPDGHIFGVMQTDPAAK